MKKLIKYNLIKDYHDLKSWISLMISVIGVRAIGVIRGFFVAKVLGPSDYGLLSSLQLISSLNKYGVLGFNAVVKREVSFLEGNLNLKK